MLQIFQNTLNFAADAQEMDYGVQKISCCLFNSGTGFYLCRKGISQA
jgi:hypothetical protein